jgi:hypothetical protein
MRLERCRGLPKLHADVKEFTAEAPPSDDLTLLAVGLRDPLAS